MDDFPGLLASDLGFRPRGKSAPMSAASKGSTTATINGIGSSENPRSSLSGKSSWNSTPATASSFLGDHDSLFSAQKTPDYGGLDDVFGGPPKYSVPSEGRAPSTSSSSSSTTAAFGLDSFFQGSMDSAKSSSLPVYDKPLYDDDIFDGVPGVKSSTSVKYEDVFSSISSAPGSQFDDLLGNFGRAEPDLKAPASKRSGESIQDASKYDDLIPGFGGTSPPHNRGASESNRPHQSTVSSTKSTPNMPEDPFVVLESTSAPACPSSVLFTDPLEHLSKFSNSGSTKADSSSLSGGAFDDFNVFDGLTKSVPSFSSEMNDIRKRKSPLRAEQNTGPSHPIAGKETTEKPSMKNFENTSHQKVHVDNHRESHQTLYEMPAGSSESYQSIGSSSFHPKDVNAKFDETNSQVDMSPKSDENLESADEIWLTVSEIPLFTQPTSVPPPSRPPPPLVIKPAPIPKEDKGPWAGVNAKKKVTFIDSVKSLGVSSIDELEDFAMGKPRIYANEPADVLSSEEEIETSSAAAASAAAMKEAMDRAEVKFKHAREVRERDAQAARTREALQLEEEEKSMQDYQEREHKEKQERLDREREQREREEKEREQKRLEREREREREREIERERERDRQAVERATKEARDRAATEARLRAERAAVGKANAEARERAERAAVQRATTEARERAAAEAMDRAEKAAAEARAKAATEAQERAAVERAAAEVQLRAERAAVDRVTAGARERAAAVAREKQYKTENDLNSFFGMGARPNSAPRQRSTTLNPAFDTQFQSKGGSEGARRSSVGTSSSIKKASSATNIVDDLSSIFGGTKAAPSAGEFQEVEGETEERRRARLERHQRTLERAAKAVAEKNDRDIQAQMDQAERHRIAETHDVEIKRWAAGKEGNLRALLSTLHYVLWPECGWQLVSLTDLITPTSVKKVYRKATLCIHPDKVQQKGANLQQKYIAEKVFDLLKEAWNKFNSEELF